ncbi:hypothetical protein ACK3TF_003891 [Chlorella vulgaris]
MELLSSPPSSSAEDTGMWMDELLGVEGDDAEAWLCSSPTSSGGGAARPMSRSTSARLPRTDNHAIPQSKAAGAPPTPAVKRAGPAEAAPQPARLWRPATSGKPAAAAASTAAASRSTTLQPRSSSSAASTAASRGGTAADGRQPSVQLSPATKVSHWLQSGNMRAKAAAAPPPTESPRASRSASWRISAAAATGSSTPASAAASNTPTRAASGSRSAAGGVPPSPRHASSSCHLKGSPAWGSVAPKRQPGSTAAKKPLQSSSLSVGTRSSASIASAVSISGRPSSSGSSISPDTSPTHVLLSGRGGPLAASPFASGAKGGDGDQLYRINPAVLPAGQGTAGTHTPEVSTRSCAYEQVALLSQASAAAWQAAHAACLGSGDAVQVLDCQLLQLERLSRCLSDASSQVLELQILEVIASRCHSAQSSCLPSTFSSPSSALTAA